MEGDVVAEELTIGGHVKGTIHANRVKLNSAAVIEGDIFHRTLAIEENARFEGTGRSCRSRCRWALATENMISSHWSRISSKRRIYRLLSRPLTLT
jgi:hypothetical protein